MTIPAIVYAGFRGGRIFALDTTYGLPDAVDDLSNYDGFEVYGAKGFTPPGNEPRRIVHTNADRAAQTQLFPSLEPYSGEITIDGSDMELLATLSGVNSLETSTMGGADYMGHFTNKLGSEINIGMILFQAAQDKNGNHGYHNLVIPSATASPILAPFADGQQDLRLAIAANESSHHLHGPDFAEGTEGFTTAVVLEAWTTYPLHIASFIADGAELDFDFDTNLQAASAVYNVWENAAGTVTEKTTAITKLTTGVDYDVAPADGTIIHIIYQLAGY